MCIISFFFLMLCLFYENTNFVYFFYFNNFIFETFFQIFCFDYFKKISLFLSFILLMLIKILSIFISVAFFTVAERKVLGAIHRRRGPNMVGFWGLLQPIADALKLFLKELILPVKSSRFVFMLAPIWILLLSVFGWVIIPIN